MSATKKTIANAQAPSDNVLPLKPAATKYPPATQSGFSIIADKHGRAGLYRVTDDKGERLVSGGIWITGQARDSDSLGWCNVVEFVDADGKQRQWLMPKSLLAGDKTEAIRELLGRGLFVVGGNEAKIDLFNYISNGGNKRFTTVERTGWHGESFVLPDRVIGSGDYLLVNPKPARPRLGTLESWRNTVAKQCTGNTRLVYAVSGAFATPLLEAASTEGGGNHYVGPSSIGKTKTLTAASTVFGVEVSSWRTTANGLEATAAEHSDIGLLLDEIGEMDARHAGEAIYMLANGGGKNRAKRDGSGRPPATWRIITQSTGEKSLSEHMATAGAKTMAGQEVRLLNIEADAGAGMGLFETIHDAATPQDFADSFDTLAKQHTGHAGPAFVQYIIDNRRHCLQVIKQCGSLFIEAHNLENETGQVQRVAKRFALTAAAGELATEAGITGWTHLEATRAAGVCFESWRNSWTPTGSREHEKAIEQVRGFIQRNLARFVSEKSLTPHNCAGYWQASEFRIIPSAFTEEVCSGLNSRTVSTALLNAGHLMIDNGKSRLSRRTAEGKQQRFYVINTSILEADEND